MTVYDIIKKPVITEKAVEAKETLNHVTFAVDPRATKLQIKQAVQSLFDVKVKNVRTMNIKGKEKRFGKANGKRNDWKKAIVVLADGETLEFV